MIVVASVAAAAPSWNVTGATDADVAQAVTADRRINRTVPHLRRHSSEVTVLRHPETAKRCEDGRPSPGNALRPAGLPRSERCDHGLRVGQFRRFPAVLSGSAVVWVSRTAHTPLRVRHFPLPVSHSGRGSRASRSGASGRGVPAQRNRLLRRPPWPRAPRIRGHGPTCAESNLRSQTGAMAPAPGTIRSGFRSPLVLVVDAGSFRSWGESPVTLIGPEAIHGQQEVWACSPR